MNSELIRYLQDILMLEQEKLVAQKTVFRLSEEIEVRKRLIASAPYTKRGSGFIKWDKVIVSYIILQIIMALFVAIFGKVLGESGMLVLACAVTVGFVVYVFLLYKKYVRESELDFRTQNQRHEALRAQSAEKIPVLQEEINQMQNYYNTANALVLQLYSKDIIALPYRTMVACGMFLEYFINGRCSTLGEAYKLYEEDIHRRKVENSLEKLNEGQQILLRQVSEINNKVDRLSETALRIEKNTAQAARNSAISVYCNAQTAKNIKEIKERWGYY